KVTDAALTASTSAVNAVEGTAFTGTVATFTDANPNAPLSDFTATITWGDGQTSAGTITVGSGGSFTVTGTHSYATEGSPAIAVQIRDVGGSTVTANTTATVADAPLIVLAAPVLAPGGTTLPNV